jgi:hypothetical protein
VLVSVIGLLSTEKPGLGCSRIRQVFELPSGGAMFADTYLPDGYGA